MKISPLCLLVLLSLPLHAGTHIWSGNGINDLFSNAANWSSGGVPTTSETSPVILHFPANSNSPTPIDDIIGLAVDGITFDGGGYDLKGNGSVTLSFKRQSVGAFAILCTNSNSLPTKINTTLKLSLSSKSQIKTDSTLHIESAISGAGGPSTQGDVWFDGASPNTYSFDTASIGGILHLAKQSGTDCIGGNLVADGGTVVSEADNQIPNSSTITMKSGGMWDTHLHYDTVGGLVFDDGALWVLRRSEYPSPAMSLAAPSVEPSPERWDSLERSESSTSPLEVTFT